MYALPQPHKLLQSISCRLQSPQRLGTLSYRRPFPPNTWEPTVEIFTRDPPWGTAACLRQPVSSIILQNVPNQRRLKHPYSRGLELRVQNLNDQRRLSPGVWPHSRERCQTFDSHVRHPVRGVTEYCSRFAQLLQQYRIGELVYSDVGDQLPRTWF